jgi:threonyl-tRNA synthetase
MIRTGEQQKIPVLAVIGEREAEAGGASLRSRREGDLGLVQAQALIQAAVAANQARAAGLRIKGAVGIGAATVSAP